MTAGLALVAADTPVRHGFAQLLAGDTQIGGAFLKGEVGYEPIQNVSLFASGGYEAQTGWGAGVGARWDFNL